MANFSPAAGGLAEEHRVQSREEVVVRRVREAALEVAEVVAAGL